MKFGNFEDLLPGCGWVVAEPYDLPIRFGLEAERARLRGCKWVLVRYEEKLYYDGIHEEVAIEKSFQDQADAIQLAAKLLKERREQLIDSGVAWASEVQKETWPKVDSIASQLIRSIGFTLSDGVGWDAHQVVIAVMPLSDTPIDNDFVAAIGKPKELQSFLRDVGKAAMSRGDSVESSTG